MAKVELGTKRTDPETGKKFYDLNRDPIVSPYTGKSYPLTFFQETLAAATDMIEEDEVQEVDSDNTQVELVSLEDADEGVSGDDIPDMGDDVVEIDGDDDDVSLLQADEDDEDMSDLIGVTGEEDDV